MLLSMNAEPETRSRDDLLDAVETLRAQATVIEQAADPQDVIDALGDIEVAVRSLRAIAGPGEPGQ